MNNIVQKQIVGPTDQATDTVAVPATSAMSSKVTALAVAQSQVVDAQRTVELLTSTAAEKKIDATYGLLTRPIGSHEASSTQVAIKSPMDLIRTQDTHDQTLCAT